MTKPTEKPTAIEAIKQFVKHTEYTKELPDYQCSCEHVFAAILQLSDRLNTLEDESDFDEALEAVIGKSNHRLSFLEERVFDFPMEEATTPAPNMLTNDLMQQQIDMIAKQSTKFDEPMFFAIPAPKEPRFWSMSDTKMNYDLEPFPSSAIHPEQRLAGIASLLNDPMTTVATKDLRAMMAENAALYDRIQRAVAVLEQMEEAALHPRIASKNNPMVITDLFKHAMRILTDKEPGAAK